MLTQQQKRINYTLQCLIKFINNAIEILSGIVTSYFFQSCFHSRCWFLCSFFSSVSPTSVAISCRSHWDVNILHLNIWCFSFWFHYASIMERKLTSLKKLQISRNKWSKKKNRERKNILLTQINMCLLFIEGHFYVNTTNRSVCNAAVAESTLTIQWFWCLDQTGCLRSTVAMNCPRRSMALTW